MVWPPGGRWEQRLKDLGWAVSTPPTAGDVLAARLDGDPETFAGACHWHEHFRLPALFVLAPAVDMEAVLAARPEAILLEPVSDAQLHVGIACLCQDREALHAQLAEERRRLREVHHRVKNNLQIVSSLLDLQAARLSDRAAVEAFADCRVHVQAMALVHEKLYGGDSACDLDAADYLESLVHTILGLGQRPDLDLDLRVDCTSAQWPAGTAVTCGLLVSELVGNSLKHAFAGRDRGGLRVSLQTTGADQFCLTVADDGVGLPAPLPAHSFGLEMIELLATQLGGDVQWSSQDAPAGACIRVAFPGQSQR